jgi:hypothetical protein
VTPEELVLLVVDCGYVVELDRSHQPTLSPTRDGAKLPPELLEQLKANRYAIRAWILAQTDPQACELCGRDVTDPEDRERCSDAAICDMGGAHEKKHWKTNEITSPMVRRCPYKKRGEA